jgi:DNA gyrase/topoisomerase IV subunit A
MRSEDNVNGPTAWLRMREAQLAALERYETVLVPLHEVESEADARAAVIASLGCGDEEAGQVLGLQLRRLARLERERLADEIRALMTPAASPNRFHR